MYLPAIITIALGLTTEILAAQQPETTSIALIEHSARLSERQPPMQLIIPSIPAHLRLKALAAIVPPLKVLLEIRPDIDKTLAAQYPLLSDNYGRIDVRKLVVDAPPVPKPAKESGSPRKGTGDTANSAYNMLGSLGSMVYGGFAGMMGQERGYMNTILDILKSFTPTLTMIESTVGVPAATPKAKSRPRFRPKSRPKSTAVMPETLTPTPAS